MINSMTRKDCIGIWMNGGLHNEDQGSSLLGDDPRLSPIEDDILSYRRVSYENLLTQDTELNAFATKWFDYREMTPLQATRHYIEAFGSLYRKHYRLNFDRKAADYITVPTVDSVMGALTETKDAKSAKLKRTFNACWRGRVIADHLGMPYDVYIDLALEYRLSYWQRRHMPEPTQLYSEMVVEKTQERWEELQARKLYLSHEPVYMVQNYRGARHQDDYHEWLFKQAFMRSNPPEFIARFINEDRLPLDKVQVRLDEFQMERVSRRLLH